MSGPLSASRRNDCPSGPECAEYRCRACKRVFNAFTHTALSGTCHWCSRLVFRSTRRALEPVVLQARRPDATILSDEWHAYDALRATGRGYATVTHRQREYARDDDGDGVREVHNHSIEGVWLGLRNFLRPFRGVSKWWLDHYVHFYACLHNHRDEVLTLLSRLLRPFRSNGP